MNEKEEKRPTFWRWGDPVTVRNPIRERWEALQKNKKNPRLEARMEYRRKYGEWPPPGWEPEP